MLRRNSHGPAESILLAVANDPLKNALAEIVGEHRYVMDARYDVIAGTTGSLAVVKKLLPGKRFVDLGHGREWGDIAAITFMIGQLAAGRIAHPFCYSFMEQAAGIQAQREPHTFLTSPSSTSH